MRVNRYNLTPLFIFTLLLLFNNCSKVGLESKFSSLSSSLNSSETTPSSSPENSLSSTTSGKEEPTDRNLAETPSEDNKNPVQPSELTKTEVLGPCKKTQVGSHIMLPASFNRHGYATRTAFNSSSPPTFIYDSNNGDITNLEGDRLGSAPFTTESHWDPQEPDTMWGIKGGLKSFGSQSALDGFYKEFYSAPVGFKIRLGPGEGEVEVDLSGQYCAVLYEYGDDSERLVSLSMDLSTGKTQVIATKNLSGYDLDKATMSKDCQKILAVYRSRGMTSYDKDLTNELVINPGDSSHADVFQTQDGQQFVYTLGGRDNHLLINLETGEKREIPRTSHLDGGHASATAEADGVIAWSPNTKKAKDDSMRLFYIGNGGEVIANIELGEAESSMSSYSNQPKISIAPDVSYAIYSSDRSGSDRTWLIPMDHSACIK